MARNKKKKIQPVFHVGLRRQNCEKFSYNPLIDIREYEFYFIRGNGTAERIKKDGRLRGGNIVPTCIFALLKNMHISLR